MKVGNRVDRQVGARLRVLRAVLEISAEKLADVLGVTVPTVDDWEAGMSCIGAEHLRKVAEIFSVAPAYFFAGTRLDGDTLH